VAYEKGGGGAGGGRGEIALFFSYGLVEGGGKREKVDFRKGGREGTLAL